MEFFSWLGRIFTDDRLLFNLVALHLALAAALLISALLRRFIARTTAHLGRVTGWPWLDEAGRKARTGLFWLTLGLMIVAVVGCVGYHLAGRHIRHDLRHWFSQITWSEVVLVAVRLAEVTGVAVLMLFAVRKLRRSLPGLERKAAAWVGTVREEHLHRCFVALDRYVVILMAMAFVWCAGKLVGLSRLAGRIDDIVFHIVVILSLAHLLTLSCHTLSRSLAAWGERYLAHNKFRRYWERVTRLFPLGERCFELAVYFFAASQCIRQLSFIEVIAVIGDRVVLCIGIFFATRIVIELSQVLLNEAFGMYQEERQANQKGETLVPLLHSVCQYVFYFGSGVMMLSVLGIPTSPILAGAGIIGLAGGLGAQSLVTDVVSGFFILFENQYLVGDYIKIGDATGRVEAVSIRCTHIRDDEGRLHIIPNGQIKGIINYSKDYVMAEVDIVVPFETSPDEVFRAMSEAGRRLRLAHREVLGETILRGLVDLTPSTMTVRAATKVQPGTHAHMKSEYRRHLRQVLEEHKTARLNPPAIAA